MLAAVFKEPGSLEIEQRKYPTIRADELLIKIHAASICGTDLKIFRGGHAKLRGGDSRVLGHELSGEIVAVGEYVSCWQIGQRICVVPNIGCGYCEMCRKGLNNMCPDFDAFGISLDGGFEEYMVIPSSAIYGGNVFAIPDSLTWQEAALVEPISCCYNAWKSLEVTAQDRVLIIGTGPMAVFFLQLANIYGVRQAIVIGRRKQRLMKMLDYGASHCINSSAEDPKKAVMNLTDERGVDVVITAAADPQIQSFALTVLARLGRVNFFSGLSRDSSVNLDTNLIHYKGLRVVGTTGSSIEDFSQSLDLLVAGRLDLDKVIGRSFTLDKISDAFSHALTGPGTKTLVVSQQVKS